MSLNTATFPRKKHGVECEVEYRYFEGKDDPIHDFRDPAWSGTEPEVIIYSVIGHDDRGEEIPLNEDQYDEQFLINEILEHEA